MVRKFHALNPQHTDPRRVKAEREKAQALKKSPWWIAIRNQGKCHHCGGTFAPAEITMDHLVPISRGGRSVRDNVVPACRACNQEKGLEAPIDSLFEQLERERKERGE